MDNAPGSSPHPSPVPAGMRCAIYTRKSTEEGLEQAFNSLEAQREAAEAYLRSQKHLGWTIVETRYDDGGFSGGSLNRPALEQLLDDIDARRVDCVVVYKVDRLSRSLLDFARLMDRFEQRSVSFVSVTQQFNTTSSLGRLTLNILLSFAQFEREIIGERTRDKMSAARRKGKWVGGTPVLGYDIDPAGGRLVVNEGEAAHVREIFDLYRRRGSLEMVVEELTRRGWTTKRWKSKRGVRRNGRPFTKTSVLRLLTNAVYCGKVEYRGVTYAGEHPAIVDVAAWDEVNTRLNQCQSNKEQPVRSQQKALLAGLVTCKSCERPMMATYSGKSGRRYRYYVCQAARRKGWKTCPTKSVSASLLEESVMTQLRTRLSVEETRAMLRIPDAGWPAVLEDDTGIVRRLIEQIRYDGRTGMVSVKLRAMEEPGNEARA